MHLSVEDVEVSVQRHVVSSTDTSGNISLDMSALDGMPRIGGAVDALKLLQYTPGVAATQEGNSAIYVRGSDAGQSMLLLNGAPLYSPSHLLGIFSSLNTPHLSGITLYKSGIPASYGSSTASIIDVRTHRYIPTDIGIEGNVGLIASDIAVQAPITTNVGLFVSARHSYSSWLTSRISSKATARYNFGDYGLGLAADLGRAGRLTMNTHLNIDRAALSFPTYNSSGGLKWWNGLGTLRLDTTLGDSVTMTNTLYSSLYRNTLQPTIAAQKYGVVSGVADFGFKSATSIELSKIELQAGFDYAFHRVQPQYIDLGEITANSKPIPNNSSEAALFASLHWPISRCLNIDAGMRVSLFANDRVWCYPEPRITIEIPISPSLRLWASYNMLTQYLQLVPQSNISFATDFYITSSEATPPQLSHNFSVGYAQHALSGHLRWSVEGYYRYMLNVIEYDSAILNVLTQNASYNDMLHSGIGESYGMEISIGYSSRDVEVNANYTLSRSLRQFDDINNGMPFLAHSDRRHSLSLLAIYRPSKHWTLSATFVYATGAPYTYTRAIYIGGNAFIREFGPYNGAKLPDLHHLDISATYWFKCNRLKQSGINISVYNVYAHENPLMISWDVSMDENKSIHVAERHSALYSILPSINWTFKF